MIRSQPYADRQTVHSAWIDVGALCLAMLPLARIFLVNDSRALAYGALAVVVALLIVAVHAYRGAEWARIAGGLAAVAIGAALIANADVVGYRGERVRFRKLVHFAAPIVAGFHLLRPASRDQFRAVREARARIHAHETAPVPPVREEA